MRRLTISTGPRLIVMLNYQRVRILKIQNMGTGNRMQQVWRYIQNDVTRRRILQGYYIYYQAPYIVGNIMIVPLYIENPRRQFFEGLSMIFL